MSSRLRTLQKKLYPDTRRKTPGRLNSRGEPVGPAYTPPKHEYTGTRKGGLEWLRDDDDVASADPKCKRCKGRGVIESSVVDSGRSKLLACSCLAKKTEAAS